MKEETITPRYKNITLEKNKTNNKQTKQSKKKKTLIFTIKIQVNFSHFLNFFLFTEQLYFRTSNYISVSFERQREGKTKEVLRVSEL